MEHDTKTKTHTTSPMDWIKNTVGKHKKIAIVLGIIIVGLVGWNMFGPKKSSTQYQTAPVQKQTIIESLGESGSVAVANRMSISTQASGVVKEVDIQNGDTVTTGQTIAVLSLDQQGLQRQESAWNNYLSAQNNLSSATSNLNTLQVTLFKTNQAFVTDRGVINPSDNQKADPVYIEENAAWLAAES